MAKAGARHILVDDEKLCNDLIEQINNGTDFGFHVLEITSREDD